MTLDEFSRLIFLNSHPVILVEGRRSITESAMQSAQRLTAAMAGRFPDLRFRSGNASGADEAFSSGVIATAPGRLEIIAPYASHRKRQRHPLVQYDSPESLEPANLESIKTLTAAATPSNRGLMKCYGRGGRAGAQAACLIRDTLKVTGIPGRLTPPVAALFWVDPNDPEAGGTGHTIRVCHSNGVPTIFQNHWESWLESI
ncbi:hypothetical protein HZ994_15275 [Akkermansiaceae bacterium]|nr:hypothetical protein HZ994_15275 [Akkermansiaceae bacterium]